MSNIFQSRASGRRSFIDFNQNILANIQAQEKVSIESLRLFISGGENADERFDLTLHSLYEKKTAATKALEAEVHQELSEFLHKTHQIFNDKLLPAYEEQRVRFLHAENLNTPQTIWLNDYFTENIQPLLNPIVLDVTHPFPRIKDKNICLFLTLKGENAYGKHDGLVIIQIPNFIEAFVRLPEEFSDGDDQLFITIEELIKKFAYTLFYGFTVEHNYFFKVIRRRNRSTSRLMKNIDLFDRKLKDKRMDDAVVRLELDERCPVKLQKLLCNTFHIDVDRLYIRKSVLNYESYLLALESIELKKTDAQPHNGWKALVMALFRSIRRLCSRKHIQQTSENG